MKHIILNLEAPLMAFGGETIDNLGVIRRFPSASMLTGLFANALGWRRIERQKHQNLQDRLVFAARIDREPVGGLSMTDFQTAQLDRNDKGWTTHGVPEGRAGGANTYNAPHLRYRDYFADMRVTLALRLAPQDEQPTLEDIEAALNEPARPLFIGRKPCLPSAPLFGGFSEGDTCLAALLNEPLECEEDAPHRVSMLWSHGEEADDVKPNRSYMLTDERNWVSGLHGGGRLVHEGSISRDSIRKRNAPADDEKDGEA